MWYDLANRKATARIKAYTDNANFVVGKVEAKKSATRVQKLKYQLKSSKRGSRLTLWWQKQSGVSGYQIRIKKSGSSLWKTVKNVSVKKTKIRIKRKGVKMALVRAYKKKAGRKVFFNAEKIRI